MSSDTPLAKRANYFCESVSNAFFYNDDNRIKRPLASAPAPNGVLKIFRPEAGEESAGFFDSGLV
jgi:hypothetical protein